ncbi:DNA-3-methyladenine glycosylase 2 family protein [Halogeometricum sp. S1BR25-6]|uniref:DNA-3-methyladenine glycosylase 2 family protein n=1 Tax=Halogeometricum salsisoli TaxID=2950536 RepID=A0ABU2GC60_9EURY|nr:DNA-3-methyladenine glycosylase 2 family protein [Halogeometricum sp. S1BR25-6]MDS0297853.1 DNA-3-methyladenine glycosylase 2 family protein [Halogeometricum sp. S1BR25-6]
MSLSADTTLALPAEPPFAFARSASVLDRAAPPAGGRYTPRDALVTGGFAPEPFVAHLSPDGPDAVRAHVDWLDGRGDGSAVAAHLDAFLSLSDDPTPLYDAAADDEAFAPVAAELRGYHHVRFPTPFEAACWAALSRRTTTPVAAARRDSLVRELGRVAVVDGETVSLFPTARTVRANPGAVRTAVEGTAADGERRSATDRTDPDRADDSESILAAAELFAASGSDLRELGTDDLRDRLASLRGFGPRAAAFVAFRGFGRASVLPTTAARLRSLVGEAYGVEDPTEETVRRLAEPYGEYRGYWAHYLHVDALLDEE